MQDCVDEGVCAFVGDGLGLEQDLEHEELRHPDSAKGHEVRRHEYECRVGVALGDRCKERRHHETQEGQTPEGQHFLQEVAPIRFLPDPVAAQQIGGVVPGFRMADEAEADVLFAQAWEEWLGERLTRGDDVLLEALDREIPLEAVGAWGQRTSLRGLARKLLEQRDLEPLAAKDAFDADAARGELLSKAARAGELAATARDGDLLAEKLKGFVSHAELASPLTGSALIDHLLAPPDVPKNFGHRPRWPSAEALEEAREIAAWSKESAAAWRTALGADVHGRLVRALGGVTALYERRKAERGVLDFLDLLVKARDALRDRPAVREHFHRRFRHVIIDEFQDTDRLQVEIARLLTGDRPGALVVVGDAKQSIYRFRRAEVRLFRELARERAEKGAVLHLKQNFRSRPAILRFVNRVFSELIEASDEADQPAYEPIDPPPGLSDEPSVVALRFPAPTAAGGDDLLHAEAGALAAFLAQAARGAHTVRDPGTGADRPSRAGDVLVLTRRLTKVRFLEEAFEAAGLRFTVEGGKASHSDSARSHKPRLRCRRRGWRPRPEYSTSNSCVSE